MSHFCTTKSFRFVVTLAVLGISLGMKSQMCVFTAVFISIWIVSFPSGEQAGIFIWYKLSIAIQDYNLNAVIEPSSRLQKQYIALVSVNRALVTLPPRDMPVSVLIRLQRSNCAAFMVANNTVEVVSLTTSLTLYPKYWHLEQRAQSTCEDIASVLLSISADITLPDHAPERIWKESHDLARKCISWFEHHAPSGLAQKTVFVAMHSTAMLWSMNRSANIYAS